MATDILSLLLIGWLIYGLRILILVVEYNRSSGKYWQRLSLDLKSPGEPVIETVHPDRKNPLPCF